MTVRLAPETPIAELATAFPGLIDLFEKKDLDFCCSGHIALGLMCQQKGLEVEQVLDECRFTVSHLTEKDDCEVSWAEAQPADLIKHILDRYHEGHRLAIDVIGPLLERVVGHHGENHPELNHLSQLITWLFHDLQPHMMKEEQVLFPLAMELVAGHRAMSHCGSILNPIGVMEAEHRHTYNLLNEIRDLSSHYRPPEQACRSYRALYANLEEFDGELRRHMHLENNVLFSKLATLARKPV